MEKVSPRTVLVSLTISLGGFLMGAVSIAHFMDEPHIALAVGACTALLSFPLADISLRARTKKAPFSMFLCVGLGYVGGVLNTAFSFIVVSSIEGHMSSVETFGISLVAGFFGFFTGGPLGLLISSVYAVLIAMTVRLAQDRSLEAFDQILVRCSGWLIGVSLMGLVGAYGTLEAMGQDSQTIDLLGFASTLLCPVSLLGLMAGALSISHRRRWLTKIRRGDVEGWAVVPIDRIESERLDLRPLLTSGEPPREVLVRRSDGVKQGAYRTGELLEPTAWV